MKKTIFIGIAFLLSILNFLCGCSDSSQEIYDEKMSEIQAITSTPAPQPHLDNQEKEPLRGTLTISTYWDFNMPDRIEEFSKLHPEVEIQWDGTAYGEYTGETATDYSQRIATELMSGQASDLVDLSGLATYKYTKSGLLVNFYDLMANDPAFQEEDYYTNIFEAMEFGGGLYAMPFTFAYDFLYINQPIAEQIGITAGEYPSFDYSQMLDIYQQALDGGVARQPFDLLSGIEKTSFWDYEFYAFYDPEKEETRFDSPEFIEYLEKTNTIVKMQHEFNRVTHGNETFMEHTMFDRLTSSCLDAVNSLIEYQYVDEAVPYQNQSGGVIFNTLQATYGISQSCENKELAWEFIKFCIQEKEPPETMEVGTEEYQQYMLWYQGNIPINKANFFHLYRYQAIASLADLEPGTKLKEGDQDVILTAALERMHQHNLRCNTLASDNDLRHLVIDDLINFYYNGLTSAEETAAIIQDKVTAYLNE